MSLEGLKRPLSAATLSREACGGVSGPIRFVECEAASDFRPIPPQLWHLKRQRLLVTLASSVMAAEWAGCAILRVAASARCHRGVRLTPMRFSNKESQK